MRCIAAAPDSDCEWHSHPFLEFSFVSQDAATIGYPPGLRNVESDTLVLYHPGENHAGWSGPDRNPRFWVVHFTAPPDVLAHFPKFACPAPDQRIWRFKHEQAKSFRWMFLQMLNERIRPRPHQPQAESAWLWLLLISVHRWIADGASEPLSPETASPDVMRLWHLVNASVGQPAEYTAAIHTLPNYDSLRHGFKRAFGCSPREMMLRLRIQHAKDLLLESSLSIKEISARCGYQRQHEFARAFRHHTGTSPTSWRTLPFLRAEAKA